MNKISEQMEKVVNDIKSKRLNLMDKGFELETIKYIIKTIEAKEMQDAEIEAQVENLGK